jgi:uncharacterized membrane protein
MTQTHDPMVERYLAAVAGAAADLPAEQRAGLLADLGEHIASARADLTHESEDAVRAILHRLGDPASIAAEARRDAPPPASPVVSPAPVASPPPALIPVAVAPRSGMPTWAIVLLALVGLVAVVCFAAVVLGFLLAAPAPTPAPAAPGLP